MSTITVEKLGKVGARVDGVDVDRLRDDDTLPEWCHETLDANGVLVFPNLHVDDETQVAFTRKLGSPVLFHWRADLPEIYPVTLDQTLNARADYLRATVEWHIDGAQDEIPAMASLLSAKVLSATGGETEFASTYVAYDELTSDEKERFEDIRVLHSLAGTQRLVTKEPTAEQEAAWAASAREHPLVWRHGSGRRSLVIGSTAVGVVGMDDDAGAELLHDLLARATTPDHVFRHEWDDGDMVIWDNRGVIHRVQPYDASSGREMHRTTIQGDEPIQ